MLVKKIPQNLIHLKSNISLRCLTHEEAYSTINHKIFALKNRLESRCLQSAKIEDNLSVHLGKSGSATAEMRLVQVGD